MRFPLNLAEIKLRESSMNPERSERIEIPVLPLRDVVVYPHMVIPWAQELSDNGIEMKQMLGQWGHAAPDRRNANHPTVWPHGPRAHCVRHVYSVFLPCFPYSSSMTSQMRSQPVQKKFRLGSIRSG